MQVVVQIMINSDVSGVCFTRNPITQCAEIIIEAIYGLGEALVSGMISGDQYILNNNGDLKEERLKFQESKLVGIGKNKINKIVQNELLNQSKRKLNTSQLHELFSLMMKIKKIYEYDVDVEWAYEKNKLYILQVRPLTT